jgi:hypothetical protein
MTIYRSVEKSCVGDLGQPVTQLATIVHAYLLYICFLVSLDFP